MNRAIPGRYKPHFFFFEDCWYFWRDGEIWIGSPREMRKLWAHDPERRPSRYGIAWLIQ